MATNPKAALGGSNPANDAAEAPKGKRGKKAKLTLVTGAPVTVSLVEQVPIARVERAPENVRKTASDVAVAELADDIAAHGLLQSLIGYQVGPESPVMICGGGRRLQALFKLREEQRLAADYTVPVLIRDREEAVELSLSENLARRDMNPADEFDAFAALMAPGTRSPADLAKRFGYTETYVKQRLRLAGLAPEILEALREERISLTVALEYAKTDDRAVQAKVFKAQERGQAYNRHCLYSIRAGINSEGATEDSAIFQFIDRKTYEKEGGGYVEDLFADLGEGQGRKLSNGTLARDIAQRCLLFQADRVVASAKADFPTIVGHVVSASLEVGGKATAPTGYVEIAGGWNSNLSMNVDIAECWDRARDAKALIQIVVGIDQEWIDDEPGKYFASYSRSRFFVPKDMAKQVWPAKRPTNYGGSQPVLTDAQREEQEIERAGRMWAARLAAPKFSDIPGFEGRAFYDRDWLDTNHVKPGDPRSGDYTPSFVVRVFVTEDEIAAHLDAGRDRAREIRDAREAARAAAEVEKEAVKAAHEARIAEILALDPVPAVVEADTGFGDGMVAWFYHEGLGGGFHDAAPGELDYEDDDACGNAYPSLADLLGDVRRIGRTFAEIEDFEAVHGPGEGDDDNEGEALAEGDGEFDNGDATDDAGEGND